jgi:hypothetical protein
MRTPSASFNEAAFRTIVLETLAEELLKEYTDERGYAGVHGGPGWSIDQRYLWEKLQSPMLFNRVRLLTDSETGHRRLDRNAHRWPINWFFLPLALAGYFTDYHVHHPIRNYKLFVNVLFFGRAFIQKLVNRN